jgi:hypothetical protein
MYRLAYRNFGDHEAMVLNHSVTNGSSMGVRWYELRRPLTGAYTLFQQSTFAPDATYRWMGSTAMDSAGDIALGYSAASSSVHPALRWTGRTSSDPMGTMRTETSVFEGPGSQTVASRWGDYSALRIDPSDDCTFWYTNEDALTNGNWETQIASFKFSNCGATQDFSLSASPSSRTVTQGNTTTYTVTVTPSGGFTGNVTLSVTGQPSGSNPTFSPTSINGGSGSSTMTTSASTPPGTYTLTITGTSGSLSHTATVTLVVNSSGGTGDFSISASPSSRTAPQGTSTTYTATVTPSGGFTGSVMLNASGLPSGATASFSPNPISPGNSTMTVRTSTSTPTGSFTLTITGTSGSLTHTASVTLVVTGFTISATPSSQTVTRPNSTTYTVTITPLNGFTGTVTFSARNLPSGATASFNPSSVVGHGTSTMTVSTTSLTSTGTFNVSIRGTSSGIRHTKTVTLIVN